VLSIPLNYTAAVGGSVPTKFAVDYPYVPYVGYTVDLTHFSSPDPEKGRILPTIYLAPRIMLGGGPDAIDHEFGHMVAWQNDFADKGANLMHVYGWNIRRPNGSQPPEDVLEEAFDEGWADYFAVAAKLHQSANTLNIPTLAPTRNDNANTRYEGHDIADIGVPGRRFHGLGRAFLRHATRD
jgi:hypothetical protein